MSDDPPPLWRGFASDNYAGVHPKILAAMAAVNDGHAGAYGDDPVTARLEFLTRAHFGPQATIFPVFNGTGANVIALQAAARRWEAVICAETSHVHADEGGAPEKMAGLKLWTVPTTDGKLTPGLMESQLFDRGFVHRAQPGVVTIAQTTEMGTVYTPDELRALADCTHRHGLWLHMDGARIANAAAALGVGFSAITGEVGVDLLSFGGTKNGAMAAEAVVVLNPALSEALPFLRKTSMQLASKMRFISAQLVALLEDGGRLALENGRHANAMAARLDAGLRALGVAIPQPSDANAVFPLLPTSVIEALQKSFRFYVWKPAIGQVRLMGSWDTTVEDVDAFLALVEALLADTKA